MSLEDIHAQFDAVLPKLQSRIRRYAKKFSEPDEAATEMLRGSEGAAGSSNTAPAGLASESRTTVTESYHN